MKNGFKFDCDVEIEEHKIISCVMCNNRAVAYVMENGEALCENCFRNNLEARMRK
ncbi:MAG TPA: hypothetical protein VMZ91_09925 [Candidatus Paceibacterota bacterium]|nr:hypothetical protein [Candidatus Paceibacterota bacterium]